MSQLNIMNARGNDPLICPNCNSINLHHESVEVFFRQKEDASTGLHLCCSKDGVTQDESMANNPSSRRDGILVTFSCEGCRILSVFSLTQHKGSSYIGLEESIDPEWLNA